MSLIECVPNFSEGRDLHIIEQIAEAIRSTEGVKLLNIDRGAAANRTVMTFAGSVEAVCQAAFLAVQTAASLIDMQNHTGEHPRIGATDVMPLVPISGITLDELVPYARALAERVGSQLGIPVYCYEAAAFAAQRVNLASCRSGEYEGIEQKINADGWRPDFGPRHYSHSVARTGISVIGARDYLVAVNFNLDTTDQTIASAIARDIRAARRSGKLSAIKAIGWYIEEYGLAQVSTNLTNIEQMPLHRAWQTVGDLAAKHGARVTGTEIIGLVPRKVLVDAGKYFDPQSDQPMRVAIEQMGLDELRPFDPDTKTIEGLL